MLKGGCRTKEFEENLEGPQLLELPRQLLLAHHHNIVSEIVRCFEIVNTTRNAMDSVALYGERFSEDDYYSANWSSGGGFLEINPACKIPAIVDDGFKLHESHAILRYLATTRHAADHWYPQDPKRRALVDSVLDWHHLHLRHNAVLLVVHRVMSLLPGIFKGIYPEHDDAVAEEGKMGLNQALNYIETVLLKGPNPFLENAEDVSIADLSLVCELKQLLLLEYSDQEDLFGSRMRIKVWVKAVENATNPEFNEVHKKMYEMAKQLQDGRENSKDKPPCPV